jgi:hypothetical protein
VKGLVYLREGELVREQPDVGAQVGQALERQHGGITAIVLVRHDEQGAALLPRTACVIRALLLSFGLFCF